MYYKLNIIKIIKSSNKIPQNSYKTILPKETEREKSQQMHKLFYIFINYLLKILHLFRSI